MYLENMVSHNAMVDAINELNRQHARRYAEMGAQIADLERKNQEMAFTLSVLEAHGSGMLAQIRALRAEHPGSRLFQETGQKNSRGRPKLVIHRDFYDKVFDAELTRATGGKVDPANHRS